MTLPLKLGHGFIALYFIIMDIGHYAYLLFELFVAYFSCQQIYLFINTISMPNLYIYIIICYQIKMFLIFCFRVWKLPARISNVLLVPFSIWGYILNTFFFVVCVYNNWCVCYDITSLWIPFIFLDYFCVSTPDVAL